MSERLLVGILPARVRDSPTPIQTQAIPPALAGRDVIGCAQTGTGKTAAFVVPIIERLASTAENQPQSLILAPNRELASQIFGTVENSVAAAAFLPRSSSEGATCKPNYEGLRQRPDILVATPGRSLDHMWNGTVNLAPIKDPGAR